MKDNCADCSCLQTQSPVLPWVTQVASVTVLGHWLSDRMCNEAITITIDLGVFAVAVKGRANMVCCCLSDILSLPASWLSYLLQ